MKRFLTVARLGGLAMGVILIGVLETGCARDADRSAAATPKMSSDEIERAVSARLNTDPALKDVKVSADAGKSEVTLSGNVETQEQRTRALSMVSAVQSSLTVTDKIDVKPREVSMAEYTEDMATEVRRKAKDRGEKVGDKLKDACIHAKITTKLAGDKDTPAHKINVDVEDNVVTLRGEVETAMAKSEAERIARQTDGVKRVNNLLKVKAT